MPRHLLILFSVSLILSSLANAYTVEQFTKGRIPGYISGFHDGDFFCDTRCDCNDGRREVGFVQQWEYYNWHVNETFLMALTDLKGRVENWNHGYVCREYKIAKPKNRFSRKIDELCLYPAERQDLNFDWTDYFTWNGQQRGLGKYGDQGWNPRREDYVNEEVCPAVCEDWMWQEHKIMGASGKGTMVEYNDVDDMCDDCKRDESSSMIEASSIA